MAHCSRLFYNVEFEYRRTDLKQMIYSRPNDFIGDTVGLMTYVFVGLPLFYGHQFEHTRCHTSHCLLRSFSIVICCSKIWRAEIVCIQLMKLLDFSAIRTMNRLILVKLIARLIEQYGSETPPARRGRASKDAVVDPLRLSGHHFLK